MKNKKEMRQAIKSWVAGIPNREWNKSLILSVGTKYVTTLYLYENSSKEKIEIEEFYNDYKHYIDNFFYQK